MQYLRKMESKSNKNSPSKITFPMHPEPIMNEPGMCKSKIGSGSSLGLKFFVSKENMELTWKIKLERGSLKFGIFRRPLRQVETQNENVSSLMQEKSKIETSPKGNWKTTSFCLISRSSIDPVSGLRSEHGSILSTYPRVFFAQIG